MANKYIRVIEVRDNKYVLFDFAIGEPGLSVELILPLDAFFEFCQTNQVTYMTPDQGTQVDVERLKWRHGDSQATQDSQFTCW